MTGRKYQAGSGSYRYSINGQEKECELNENITTALYWEYDSRIVRRWNVDPKQKVGESSYMCFGGNPIGMADPNGDVYKPNIGGPGPGTSTRDNPSVIGIKAHTALSTALGLRNMFEATANTPTKWVTNSTLPNGKRPDVVDEDNKKVWELKPASNQPYNIAKNKNAVSQIGAYVTELNNTRGGGYAAGGTIYQVPIIGPQVSADGQYIFTYFVTNPSSGIIYYNTTVRQPVPAAKPITNPFKVPAVNPATYAPKGGFVERVREATGLTGIALALYLIVSEGTRIFPARNLIPIL